MGNEALPRTGFHEVHMVNIGFRRILIAVDESPIAAHAADIGIAMANCLKSEVAFMYVIDSHSVRAGEGVSSNDALKMAELAAREFLSAFRERAGTTPPALEFLETGKPSVKIVEAAKCWPADLVVIGSHGREGLGRLLLGSVAESVVRHASCPVLVVRSRN